MTHMSCTGKGHCFSPAASRSCPEILAQQDDGQAYSQATEEDHTLPAVLKEEFAAAGVVVRMDFWYHYQGCITPPLQILPPDTPTRLRSGLYAGFASLSAGP